MTDYRCVLSTTGRHRKLNQLRWQNMPAHHTNETSYWLKKFLMHLNWAIYNVCDLNIDPRVCFFPDLVTGWARPIPLAQPEACPQRSERPVCARSPHRSRNGYQGGYCIYKNKTNVKLLGKYHWNRNQNTTTALTMYCWYWIHECKHCNISEKTAICTIRGIYAHLVEYNCYHFSKISSLALVQSLCYNKTGCKFFLTSGKMRDDTVESQNSTHCTPLILASWMQSPQASTATNVPVCYET